MLLFFQTPAQHPLGIPALLDECCDPVIAGLCPRWLRGLRTTCRGAPGQLRHNESRGGETGNFPCSRAAGSPSCQPSAGVFPCRSHDASSQSSTEPAEPALENPRAAGASSARSARVLTQLLTKRSGVVFCRAPEQAALPSSTLFNTALYPQPSPNPPAELSPHTESELIHFLGFFYLDHCQRVSKTVIYVHEISGMIIPV